MKYIKSFADTSTMNAFIDSISDEGCYLLRDESKSGKDRIISYKYVDYFVIVANENSTVSFNTQQTDIQYNINGGNWINYVSNTAINLSAGDKLYWLRNGSSQIKQKVGQFTITGSVDAKGNIYSLITNEYKTLQSLDNWGKYSIFESGAEGILQSLFQNCSALRKCDFKIYLKGTACYKLMLSGCSNLIKAPKIDIPNFLGYGYFTFKQCFQNSPNINEIYCPIKYDSSSTGAYKTFADWLSGVSSTGTFYKKRGENWPRSTAGIPTGWTVVEVDK